MTSDTLYAAVARFAASTHVLPEWVLNNGAWSYDAYDGVRYALLHTTLELHRLAVELMVRRQEAGRFPTRAQHALRQHQAAFRDVQALLLGLDEQDFRHQPAPHEWPANVLVQHMHEVERFFFAAIRNVLLNPEPQPLDDVELAEMAGEPVEIAADQPLELMWAEYARLHTKIIGELQGLSDEQLALRSPAWEPEPWPTVRFRMHRFDAHLREHANQLEKNLGLLDARPSEAKLLLRQMYAALAEVEGACIGDGGLGAEACAAMALTIDERLASLQAVLPLIEAMIAAVSEGDQAAVELLLQRKPGLAYTLMEDGLPAILFSQYRNRKDIVQSLLASGMRLTLGEAAAVGDGERVRKIAKAWPAAVHEYTSDGFTPLQLACFFGHADIAAFLVAQGADVHAVAKNAMAIQPLHAAVAGQYAAIVRLLIGHGADVNARQQSGFTPLRAARQNNDKEIETLLLDAGAEG
jgi:uncharacterized protein